MYIYIDSSQELLSSCDFSLYFVIVFRKKPFFKLKLHP